MMEYENCLTSQALDLKRNLEFNSFMKKKILIVDDDRDFRLMLAEMLVNFGQLVLTASNGQIALNKLETEQKLPDLILLDLIMPVKSGTEFRLEQLQNDYLKSIPVVFMTGLGVVEGENSLLKPFSSNELMNLLRLL